MRPPPTVGVAFSTMAEGQERSYEKLGEGQQLYRQISYCSNAETLWSKIESGHYDWLGVSPPEKQSDKPRFIVGMPPRRTSGVIASVIAKHDTTTGVPSGAHRVVIASPSPYKVPPSESHWHTPEQARDDFALRVQALRDASGSGLHRVTLYIDDLEESQEFVVRALPNKI